MKTSLLARFEKWVAYQLALLPHRPRLWWHRLWIRTDEFHHSLNMDVAALARMNDTDSKKYLEDLVRRRDLAHNMDLLDWRHPRPHEENFFLRTLYAYRARRFRAKLQKHPRDCFLP